MDKLDYGLSEPQMVLLQDGSVFLAGQVQAPMDPPPVTQSQPQGMRVRAAASVATTSLTTGMTLLGEIAPSGPMILGAYPEEAAYVMSQAGGKQVSTVLTWNSDMTSVRVPGLTRISVPLPFNATGALSPSLPIGTNTNQGYFILKVRKPWKGYKIGKVWVTLNVGSAKQVVQSGLSLTGDGPNSSGAGFYQVLRGNVDTSGDKRSWMATWLPAAEDPKGLIEYYRVQITKDQNVDVTDMMNVPYGQIYGPGGAQSLPPPGHYMCYDFKIQGNNPFDSFASFTSRCKVIGLWSVSQYFQNYWYGSWDQGQTDTDQLGGDKWASFLTYEWLTNPRAVDYIGPINDITLEHGNNGVHNGQHYSGNEFDMMFPGYTAIDPSCRSGTTIRNALINHMANAGAGNTASLQVLTNWVTTARNQIEQMLTGTDFGNGIRIQKIEFLPGVVNDPDNENANIVQSCVDLWELLRTGSVGDITLPDIGSWASYSQLASRIIHDGGIDHTHHAHVRLARPDGGWSWGLNESDN